MDIIRVPIELLKGDEELPRVNVFEMEKIKQKIEEYGFIFPIWIDKNYNIVHGRIIVRACREMGIQTVPCVIAEKVFAIDKEGCERRENA